MIHVNFIFTACALYNIEELRKHLYTLQVHMEENKTENATITHMAMNGPYMTKKPRVPAGLPCNKT